MFKLDHLEISGFKSFVDPVSVKFTGMLNAIVGPNGCGKSNVSDAVTWVLGERSAKTLRASQMADVIFNGSAGRKPLGMAEVTLTLLADPSVEQAEDGKLVIGRRLHRSGESQYLINGKVARLKEIKDLLMGTGLGIRAYSVIEQGRIDAILSGKPQERRRLLEEAAGITKYKERKRLAELKLEEARANLARIDDIVSEVERSLRSLKRQANAAQRYGERRAQHDARLERVLLKRWHDLRTRLAELERSIAEKTARESELLAELHGAEAELESGRESVDRLAESYSELRQRESELVATIEGKQQLIKGSRQLLEEIAERLESGEAAAAERRAELERLAASRQSFEEIHASTSSATEDAAKAVSETDRLAATTDQAVAEAEASLGQVRSELLASHSAVNSLKNELHRLEVESEKGAFRSAHLAEELRERTRARQAARQAAEEGREGLEHLTSEADAAGGRADETAARIEDLSSDLEATRSELEEVQQNLLAARQRRELLSELAVAQREKRRRIAELLAENGREARFLGEEIRIPEGWERSVDLYLAELADAVVLPPGSTVEEIEEVFVGGRGVTRFLSPREEVEARSPIAEEAIVAPLAEALGLDPAVAAALPAAYLVESTADAVRLARRHPGIGFVSRERAWAESGLLHLQGAEAEPGALARQQELDRLGERESRLAERRAALEAERSERTEELRGLERERAEREQARTEARRRLAVAEARQEDLDRAARRLDLEVETLTAEREEVGREIERLAGALEEGEQKLSAAEKRHRELEQGFEEAQQALDAARGQREEARTSSASRKGQLDLLQERLEAHQRGMERIALEIAGHEQGLARWRDEKAALEARRERVEERISTAERELQEALEARSGSEGELREREETLRSARSSHVELEQTVRRSRDELEALRAELGEIRVTQAGLKQDAGHLGEDYREHFERPLPESFEVPEASLEELEVDLERSKQLLARMGPINELAAQEYEEHEERHEFLTTQREDVTRSVERLRETIREINQTSSERFAATFEEVNQAFGKTFVELFNGGEAEMRLQDEEDLLESGIEIVARPPGKRLQNIMLLSGGEKALTALALLFALFRTKPSPFCILDEVDAPLDDVNTLRFVQLLKKMAGETQFVVITHNKLTMAAASALYGVTMEERGVSRIVSVELDEIHPQEEAASA